MVSFFNFVWQLVGEDFWTPTFPKFPNIEYRENLIFSQILCPHSTLQLNKSSVVQLICLYFFVSYIKLSYFKQFKQFVMLDPVSSRLGPVSMPFIINIFTAWNILKSFKYVQVH